MSECEHKLESVEVIFERACQLQGDKQKEYVERACHGDASLQAEVQSMLAARAEQGDFLADPTLAITSQVGESAGTVIGRYKLLQQIGEGAFGVVFMAEQREPVQRKVALKIIKAGMDTKQVIARFEAERQALALMEHPNIAGVIDAGNTDSGRPYFVMELVKGVPITEYCDKNELSTRERLDLFIKVCQGVQHAHQKGVIHRDLKPTNIMVTLRDGKAIPKVIDFGVSKAISQRLTEKTLFTAYGQMVGTPQYMSPEQAEMSELDVDTRSDIYSLGVLLYELLTGTTPLESERLRSAGFAEMQRIICEEDPPKPSLRLSSADQEQLTVIAKHRGVDPRQLRQAIRGELDWIVMKSLEKDRGRRYESTTSLVDDIGRFLQDKPVEAGPPTVAYKVRKFIRRNRLAVFTVATILLILVIAVAGTSIGMIQATLAWRRAEVSEDAANREATRAKEARKRAQGSKEVAEQEARRAQEAAIALKQRIYVYAMSVAFQAWQAGTLDRLRELLLAHIPEKGEKEDLRGFEWRFLWARCQENLRTMTLPGVSSFVYSPCGRYLAIQRNNGEVVLRNLPAGKSQSLIAADTASAESDQATPVAFSPEGRFLVTGGGETRLGAIRLWRLPSGQQSSIEEVPFPAEHDARVLSLSVSGNEALCASVGEDATIKVWEMPSGKLKWARDSRSTVVVFSPEPEALVTFDGQGTINAWHVSTGEPKWTASANTRRVYFAFPPKSNLLATRGRGDGAVMEFWDLDTGVLRAEIGLGEYLFDMAFCPDGKLMATASTQGVRLWDMTGEGPKEHRVKLTWRRCLDLDFSPDGQTLAAGGHGDSAVRLYNLETWQETAKFLSEGSSINELLFSTDGRQLAFRSKNQLRLWDLEAAKANVCRRGSYWRVALAASSDGRTVATNGENHTVRLWNTATGETRDLVGHTDIVVAVAFSPDCTKLASGSHNTIRLWGVPSGDAIGGPLSGPSVRVGELAFSPDGTQLASVGGWSGPDLRLWDLGTRKGQPLSVNEGDSKGVSFSPDGRYLATAGSLRKTNPTRLWDVTRGDLPCIAEFHHSSRLPGGVFSLAFSPDGQMVATADRFGKVELLEIPTFKRFRTIRVNSWVTSVAFSPDGTCLATAGPNGEVRFWRPTTGEELGVLKVNEGIRRIAFFPDGNALVSASMEGNVRLWRATPVERIPRFRD